MSKQPTFNLVITERQAKVLWLILNRVGGSPDNSLRGEANAIRKTLDELVPDPESTDEHFFRCQDAIDRTQKTPNSIYFKDGVYPF